MAVQDGTEEHNEDKGDKAFNASISTPGNANGTENIESYHCREGRLGEESQQASMNLGHIWSPESQHLLDFSLRQVITSSNDVMRHMLPVIHFAIHQGLNEFRHVIPFVINFPKLNRILLVDLLERVTINLGQHHLDEICYLYLLDMRDWKCDKCDREYVVNENNINYELRASGNYSKTNQRQHRCSSCSQSLQKMVSLDNK